MATMIKINIRVPTPIYISEVQMGLLVAADQVEEEAVLDQTF